jgi:hypothetical protein
MQFCEECGSTSFDEQGFCRGCGVRRTGVGAALPAGSATSAQPVPPPTDAKATIGSIPLAEAQVKNVWVAVMLALFLGPLGMTYCTYLGAAVMLFLSIFAAFLPHPIVVLCLLQLACAVWAGFAARSANSIY